MSDAKRTKNYIVFKLRKNYREGKLDTSQVARLKAIGFDFDGAVFNASKDSLRGSMEADWEAPSRGLAFAVKIPISPLTANIGAIQMIWSQE